MLVASGGQRSGLLAAKRTAARIHRTMASGNSPAVDRWLARRAIPLSAALYLKRVEGESSDGSTIVPVSVSARTHEITRMKTYRDEGFLRTSYTDVEDYGQMHITFSDGTVADIFSSELVLGGVHSWLEIFANNHRTRCNLIPMDALQTFNPQENLLKDVYITEKSAPSRAGAFPLRTRIGRTDITTSSRTSWNACFMAANRWRGPNWGVTPSLCFTAPTSPPNAKEPKWPSPRRRRRVLQHSIPDLDGSSSMAGALMLSKYSIGVGDRFAHQGKAQLRACMMAAEHGVEVIPVWNKSNREHTIIGSISCQHASGGR